MVRRLEQEDFARLVGAVFGVAIGSLVALAVACLVFPVPGAAYDAARHGTLDSARAWGRHEEREMAFFVFTLMLGGALGYVGAARCISGQRLTIWAIPALVAIDAGASRVIGAAMRSDGSIAAVYAALAIAVLLAATWLLRRLAGDFATSRPEGLADDRVSPVPIDSRPALSVLVGVLCVAITMMFVVPFDARHVATAIGFDMHIASFMVGPATYSFAGNLLPGMDYFTQYSVGTPWLFSLFFAPTASETIVNAVWFVVAEILFFQLSLLLFLRWFLRSWGWALVVSLACLMLQFTTERPFYAPSSTSARYPLLIVCVALFAHWVRRDLAWPAALPLALALSGSLFLNTETGIYTCAATAIAAIVVGPGFLRPAVRTIALGTMTFIFFALWNVLAFGPGVLQFTFFWLLLEPLMLYSSGLGAWPIEWRDGYHWLYNIISPGLALATIGWVAASARRSALPCPRSHLAGLAMVALVGLFLTSKYINMSVVALWQVNAIGLTVVMAWWLRALLQHVPARWLRAGQSTTATQRLGRQLISPRAVATTAVALASLAFLCTIGDPRNPSLYAVVSYRVHPTLVNELLGGPTSYPCPPERAGCSPPRVPPQDVALIDRLTRPDERVALVMIHDWPILIEAKRASKFHFLPSAVVFTERQMRESLRDIDLIILPREPADKLGISHPDMAPILVPMLKDHFEVVDESPTLLAWRRRGGK
jgi:hypothetical protein